MNLKQTAFALALLATVGALYAVPKVAEDQAAKNKKMVVEFYNRFFNKHDISAALEHLTEDYKQHNPSVATGRKPVIDFFSGYFKQFPNSRADIKRVVAEGDLVILHLNSKADAKDLGRAVVDIFRVQNGKIVEHWDVIQPVPAKSANSNTMF